MAKQKTNITFALYPNAKGDLYAKSPKWRKDGSGKFDLSSDLSQRDLEFIFNDGHTQIVYKIED